LNGRFFSNPPFVFWVALFEPFLRQSQAWVNLLGLAQQIHIWTVLFINHACWGPFDLCLFFFAQHEYPQQLERKSGWFQIGEINITDQNSFDLNKIG
jgi:hypothetical protein